MPAAKAKASRHAVTGLLAPEKVSLPVASFVALAGRDETLSNLNVAPGHHAEPPSPAEQ